MTWLESKIDPGCKHPKMEEKPWAPDIERSNCINVDMAGVFPVLPTKNYLTAQACNGQPSIPSLNLFVIPFLSPPGGSIFVSFSESDSTNAKPHEKADYWERMKWWDQEIVINEESIQEKYMQEHLNVDHYSKPFVIAPYLPIPDALFTFRSPEVVLDETHPVLNIKAECNSWNI